MADQLFKTIRLAIFGFPSIHPGRMGIGNYFMNTNVSIY
nr:MAG TPA: PsbA, PsbB, PsbC, PsbD, PsbE-FCP supercomplex, PLANT PROTEIN [Caudoviricetes sp.]DAN99789.1 MAG TPA: PsbA, PsbB, PsbC, PsbD, PsbE-FCP supercomplex, PLANT PROTEIN [Caudoviricetes sp.]